MKFKYYLGSDSLSVNRNDRIWNDPLPVDRQRFIIPAGSKADRSFSYGQYFRAIRRFIESQAGLAALRKAWRQQSAMEICENDIRRIDVILVKHGQYYHPARLHVTVNRHSMSLILNVAVSPDGRDCLTNDYQSILKLQQRYSFDFLPKVYWQGAAQPDETENPIQFGLGQWLDDYHEFHLAPDATRIVLWHTADSHVLLSEEATRDIYAQATRILTAYYNLETFEHIFAWHHAAGDFVAKTVSDRVLVKLTTVRQYVPILSSNDRDLNVVFHALLLFLLGTSIRMRMDRCDGVGDFLWAEDIALEGVIDGFWGGLQMQIDAGRTPIVLIDQLQNYLSLLSGKDIYELLEAIIKRTYSKMPELPIVKRHLRAHAAVFKSNINRF